MKKLYSLLAILAIAAVGYSAAPAGPTAYGIYENGGIDTIIKSTAGFDTLGATDSTTILSGHIFDSKWEYILVRDAITGTGSDSVKVAVRVDALDNSNNILYSVNIDSMTAAAGEAIKIPLTETVFGSKIRIKLVTYTDNGTQVIINRLHIYKRRPVTITKMF